MKKYPDIYCPACPGGGVMCRPCHRASLARITATLLTPSEVPVDKPTKGFCEHCGMFEQCARCREAYARALSVWERCEAKAEAEKWWAEQKAGVPAKPVTIWAHLFLWWAVAVAAAVLIFLFLTRGK